MTQSNSHDLEFIPLGSSTLCPRVVAPVGQGLAPSGTTTGLLLWCDLGQAPHRSSSPGYCPFPEPGSPAFLCLQERADIFPEQLFFFFSELNQTWFLVFATKNPA